MRKFTTKNGALVRAILIVSSIGVLTTGVTFASLQSQQALLTGNSIQTASAGLLIGTASATSSAYSSSHTGFNFTNIIPGGSPMPSPGNTFYLKNNGSAPLQLKMSVGSTPTNTANVDLAKVNVVITRVDTGTTQLVTLQSLMDGYPSNGLALNDALAPGSTGTQYQISIGMAADAFSGNTASIGGIDFVFSGTGFATT